MPELIAAVERFRADLAALIGSGPMRLGVAVSGGADSLALLLLAHHAFPGDVRAATVDHGLRAEAADEAEFVAGICAARAIPHCILRPLTPITGSVQAAARTTRYALLGGWAEANDITWIATAHHVDDQAETLMMRLNRGSGVAGLAGVRAMNGRIIRPLLGWRHAALVAVVTDAGLGAIDDPSNHDSRFDRVQMRQHLAAADWINPVHLAKSATVLAEADTALDWASAQLAKERLTLGERRAALDPALLPREFRRRLTLLALRHVDSQIDPRGDALAALISALGRDETRTLGAVLCKGGARWTFRLAAPRQKNDKSASRCIDIRGGITIC